MIYFGGRQKGDEMKFEEYHDKTGDTAEYPGVHTGNWMALSYVGLGLFGELGEVSNQLKKIVRDDNGKLKRERRTKIIDELGDAFWYLSRLCRELRVDPEYVMEQNYLKLRARKEDGTLHGDRRGELTPSVDEEEVDIVLQKYNEARQENYGAFNGEPAPTEEDLANGLQGYLVRFVPRRGPFEGRVVERIVFATSEEEAAGQAREKFHAKGVDIRVRAVSAKKGGEEK